MYGKEAGRDRTMGGLTRGDIQLQQGWSGIEEGGKVLDERRRRDSLRVRRIDIYAKELDIEIEYVFIVQLLTNPPDS
jgi:hypothetical protein